MQIEIGKRYDNKTWRFLFPCLRGHGDIFASKINPLYKLAVGVYDYTLKDQTKFNGRNIFILLDMYSQNKLCTDFIEFVKYQSYYVTHYCPDTDFGNSRKMMIVISIPERFEPAYDAFIRGKYSEMYNEEEVRILFSNPDRRREYDILSKSTESQKDFLECFSTEFGISCSTNYFDLPLRELELPPRLSEEIFNYPNNESQTKFIEQKDKIWI